MPFSSGKYTTLFMILNQIMFISKITTPKKAALTGNLPGNYKKVAPRGIKGCSHLILASIPKMNFLPFVHQSYHRTSEDSCCAASPYSSGRQ
jgi:hypothetical protein